MEKNTLNMIETSYQYARKVYDRNIELIRALDEMKVKRGTDRGSKMITALSI